MINLNNNRSNKIRHHFHNRQISNRHKNKTAVLIDDANNYLQKNKLSQANYLYQQAIEYSPDNHLALAGLGKIATLTGMLFLAVDFFSKACDTKPEDVNLNINLAQAYARVSRFDDAILQYISTLDLDENNSEIHKALAELNLQTGNQALALQYYKHAFDLNPEDHEILRGLVQIDASALSAENIAIVENNLENSQLSLDARSSIYFSLAKIYHAAGRYDEASANYLVANISKGRHFDTEKHVNYVRCLKQTFSQAFFERFGSSKLNQSQQPVFIVGMPCAGEDLVEKQLSSHPEIFSAGAQDYLQDIFIDLDVVSENEALLSLDSEHLLDDILVDRLNKAARYYLNEMNNRFSGSTSSKPRHIINTLSANYLHLGLIAVLFPNAKVIHCQRDPLEVCLLNYFKDFSSAHEYAYEQKDVVLYFKQYQQLMAHWQRVLPLEFLTVSYQELIDSTETTSRKIAKFVDFKWQPVVESSNKEQNKGDFTQPEHWQHYKNSFVTLVNALESVATDGTESPLNKQ